MPCTEAAVTKARCDLTGLLCLLFCRSTKINDCSQSLMWRINRQQTNLVPTDADVNLDELFNSGSLPFCRCRQDWFSQQTTAWYQVEKSLWQKARKHTSITPWESIGNCLGVRTLPALVIQRIEIQVRQVARENAAWFMTRRPRLRAAGLKREAQQSSAPPAGFTDFC